MNKSRKITSLIIFTLMIISSCGCLQSQAKIKNPDVYNDYREVLYDIYSNPENYFMTYSDVHPLEYLTFSVGDLNSDNTEELIVDFDISITGHRTADVFRWNENTEQVELFGYCSPGCEYYSTGYIKNDASHNQGCGSMWPYNLLQFSDDGIINLYAVDSLEKSICEEYGREYPYAEDTAGDGIVYELYDYHNEKRIYLTKEEFAAFEEKYIPGSAKIELQKYDLTPENIEIVLSGAGSLVSANKTIIIIAATLTALLLILMIVKFVLNKHKKELQPK